MYSNVEYCGANIIQDLNPPSIEHIRIPTKNGATKAPAPPTEPELPDSVWVMGRFLLNMLRIKYKRHQVPIINLSIADANMWLKDKIRKFLKAILSWFVPHAKSHSIVYTLTSLDHLTYLAQDSPTQSVPIWLCPTQPLRPAPIAFKVQPKNLVGCPPHGLGDIEAFQDHVALMWWSCNHVSPMLPHWPAT